MAEKAHRQVVSLGLPKRLWITEDPTRTVIQALRTMANTLEDMHLDGYCTHLDHLVSVPDLKVAMFKTALRQGPKAVDENVIEEGGVRVRRKTGPGMDL